MAEPAENRTAEPASNVADYTVSELAGAIRRTLEDGFSYVRLRGEVSGFRGPHASGHCYFALKDDKAKIEAVVWRGTWGRLRIKPEEGMEVVVTGRVSSFPGSSKYQIVIDALEPAGAGALMAQLEERKRRLAAEGLFAEARKRPLPHLPRVVGIVTSPTGAVIRDMLHGFEERFPTCVLVWPVRVQGEGSAREVAAAVRGFNALRPGGPVPVPDVLIVARGGGSLEDLWSFNDELVVRAVAESRLPVISAVGHETDWTLIDLAADARAPTPTKAAEWAVPKHADLALETEKLALRIAVAMRRRLEASRRDLRAAARGLPRADALVAMPRQRLDASTRALDQALRGTVDRRRGRLATAAGRLPRPRTLVATLRQRFDATAGRLDRALLANRHTHLTRHARLAARLAPHLLAGRTHRARDRLDGFAARATHAFCQRIRAERRALESRSQLLASLGYQSVLARGFAVVRDAEGRAVRHAAAVHTGQRLEIELTDGRVDVAATGDGRAKPSAHPAATPSPAPRRTRPEDGGKDGQGSLF